MANYYGSGRSNYFRVKDQTLFAQWCEDWECEAIEGDDNTVGFLVQTDDGTPYNHQISEQDGEPFDFEQSLQKLILPKEVVIFFSCGFQKMRYGSFCYLTLTTQNYVWTTLQDLYDKTQEQFGPTSLPEY